MTTNILTIDVEDWFQVENLKSAVSRASWDSREIRVEGNVGRLLDLLDSTSTRATFFTLGWIAERCPAMVRETHARGHEIASHGYAHELIYNQTDREFEEDLRKSRQILEDLTGHLVIGYRAPSFSITARAIEILKDTGFAYDSSYFPVSLHSRYGRLGQSFAPRYAPSNNGVLCLNNGLMEFPPATIRMGRLGIPWGGGAYFRLLPYVAFSIGVKYLLDNKTVSAFYFHPWEIDAGQPRIPNLKMNHRIRHYTGLKQCHTRLTRFISEFRFTSIRGYLAERFAS